MLMSAVGISDLCRFVFFVGWLVALFGWFRSASIDCLRRLRDCLLAWLAARLQHNPHRIGSFSTVRTRYTYSTCTRTVSTGSKKIKITVIDRSNG